MLDRENTRSLTPEERIEIRQLLERLTHINHRVVAARFLLGESAEEIAAELGLSPVAVRQRIFRCLTRLRREAEAVSDSGHPNEFSPGCHNTATSG